ncbi:hypothetical protein Hanom_Chr15g01383541 [Helianthus anomalus]
MKINAGCVMGQMALANHFGNLKEAFIPSLVKKRAYRRCSKNTKKLQLSKSCQNEEISRYKTSFGSKKKKVHFNI